MAEISASKRSLQLVLALLGLAACVTLFAWPRSGILAAPSSQEDGLRIGVSEETGAVTFIGVDPSRPLRIAQAARSAVPEDQAHAYLANFSDLLGIRDAKSELRLARASEADSRRSVLYQQVYRGIPVLAGEFVVNLTDAGSLLSISGEFSPDLNLPTAAKITAAQARETALAAVARSYAMDESAFQPTAPSLWIFDERLIRPSARPAELVWRLEVRGEGDTPIDELVLVNAERGGVVLHFNQIDTSWNEMGQAPPPRAQVETPTPSITLTETPTPSPSSTETPTPSAVPSETPTAAASDTPTPVSSPTNSVPPPTTMVGPSFGLDRLTYTASNGPFLPGTLLCDETQPNCTGGSDLHADAAHIYAGDTYAFYLSHHGRDSLDNLGLTLVSTVHYSSGYVNAFWSGSQMVYGDGAGFPLADDVVGHELTHGVTQYESNLFYYYQSGAINESFSDLWGEFVDQTNGAGTDTPAVRWRLGEDVSGLGAIRDMAFPPTFSDPDRMTSGLYYILDGDNGGVHTNSGINNKAVYLLTDGGVFNGKAVTPLGLDKVAAIYYEAQTNLLTSGSDYGDLYNILYQACLTLVGAAEGITSDDCQEVRDATDAVEMNLQPVTNFNPEASACPAGMSPASVLFFDDLESGSGNWSFGTLTGTSAWSLAAGYAASGQSMLWGDDFYTISDSFAAMSASVLLPLGSTPYLHFRHAFGFEDPNYDGGWLEVSTNEGGSWSDAGSLFDEGMNYNGTISSSFQNPNPGHAAFVSDSHGYVSTRYNLSSLAGQSVRFRWRTSTDEVFYDWGWFVDDVQILTCVTSTPGPTPTATPTPIFVDVLPGHWAKDYIEALYLAGYVAGCNTNPRMYCPSNTMNRAEGAVFVVRGVHGGGYLPPDPTSQVFGDVPLNQWYAKWADRLWIDGYTAGCQASPPLYCPLQGHTRAEAAVFFLRMLNGASYVPPSPTTPMFADVALTDWFAKWVHAAFDAGLILPCSTSPGLRYCPNDPLTRDMAAYMMVQAKGGLPLP